MDNVDYYTLDIYFRKTDRKRFIRETNLNIAKLYLFLKLSSSLRKKNNVYLFHIILALLLLGLTYKHGPDLNNHESKLQTKHQRSFQQ